MIWFRRNRVALTILTGLALIALVAIGQSAVAFFAIARFGTSFNEIAATNLPALIAASQLSQLSQTLVATAPEIALANTQLRRQAIIDQLNERAAALAGLVSRVGETGTDHAQVADLQRELNVVVTNLKGLDEFVRRRIDASNAFEAIVIRLPNLAGQVRKVADAAIIGRQDDESSSSSIVSSADQTHLVEWSAAALECITLMLTTPAVDNGSRLDRVKSEIQALIDRMSRAQEKLPQALQSGTAPVHDAIAQFGLGP